MGVIHGLAARQWQHGEQEFLEEEAAHLFYKKKWHPEMEAYPKLLSRFPRNVPGQIQLALRWECASAASRAAKVLGEARRSWVWQGWKEEAAQIEQELAQMISQQ